MKKLSYLALVTTELQRMPTFFTQNVMKSCYEILLWNLVCWKIVEKSETFYFVHKFELVCLIKRLTK